MAFAEILGEQLLTKDGLKATEAVLSGKTTVGIYFSAHWCPPCRGFTPQLAKMYSEAFSSKGMEIVFVSSDMSEQEFKSYYGEMPWVALPFGRRDLSGTLSEKYRVKGVPTFVILGPDGKTITTEGRDTVSSDPTGEKYPWVPPTDAEKAKAVRDISGAEIEKATESALTTSENSGALVSDSVLESKKTLSLEEVVQSLTESQREKAAGIVSVFQSVDKAQTGKVPRGLIHKLIKRVMAEYKDACRNDTIEQLLDLCDHDRDGFIKYETFVAVLYAESLPEAAQK